MPDTPGRLNFAVARGLITRAQVESEAARAVLSQGQYAVLLWKAFADLLPAGTSVGTIDPDASPEERLAIEGLERAGVFAASGPPLAVAEPLTVATESNLLEQIARAVRGITRQ